MAIEIERKFTLRDPKLLEGLAGEPLTQGYLGEGAMTVRVRHNNEKAWLTLKGPAVKASRPEFEYPIPLEDALQMLGLPGVASLQKVRFRVEHKGLVYEIDQYLGPLQGLYTVEVELERVGQHVELPPWAGQELTGQRAWDNDMLAKFGRP